MRAVNLHLHWFKVAILTAAVILFARLLFTLTPSQLQQTVLSFGPAAAVGYVVLFTVLALVLFPTTVLIIAGGMAFGTLYGTVYAMIACTLSALVAFGVGRKFSGTAFGKLLHARATKFQLLGRHAIASVFVLRQFAPYDAVSYAAGLSRISLRDFFIGSTLGTIPGLLLAVFLGDALLAPGTGFLLPLVLLAALMLGTYLWHKNAQ